MAQEIQGQLGLFGDLFGEEAVTTTTEEKGATTAATTGTTPKSSKSKAKTTTPKPEPKIHGDWKADFYGNVFDVRDYVEEIPEEGIEVEVLRQEMKKDFAGLSKERAYWEIDEENKYIFLFQKGTSKGVF